MQDAWSLEPDVGLGLLTHWRLTTVVTTLLFVGHLPRGTELGYTASLPLLTVSLWFLPYIFICGRSLLLDFQYFSSTVILFSSVQSLSHFWLFETPCTGTHQASLSITKSWNLFKLMSIQSVMPSNHLILCCPLLLLTLIFPSIIAFSNESAFHIMCPKYWSFGFSISLPKEYSGLISFRFDWVNLLAVQGTLKSLLQHHSSKASIWEGNKQERQGFPNRGNRLQVSDIFYLS